MRFSARRETRDMNNHGELPPGSSSPRTGLEPQLPKPILFQVRGIMNYAWINSWHLIMIIMIMMNIYLTWVALFARKQSDR